MNNNFLLFLKTEHRNHSRRREIPAGGCGHKCGKSRKFCRFQNADLEDLTDRMIEGQGKHSRVAQDQNQKYLDDLESEYENALRTGNKAAARVDERDIRYSKVRDKQETSSIKEQIRNNLDTLNAMDAVAEINTEKYIGLTTNEARIQILLDMDQTGFEAHRKDFGTILMGKS